MKNILILLITLLPLSALAQFPTEQYKTDTVTWYGIDYTQCYMVGAEGFTNRKRIVQTYFDAWNEFVNTEPHKYDIPRYLIKPDIIIDLSLVHEKNVKLNPHGIVKSDVHKLTQTDVTALLAKYDFHEVGLGVMLFAEYYSKRDLEASYFFVVFDAQTKKIIRSRRYIQEPAGFGFRNFWAKTFYGSLKWMNKDIRKWLRQRG